MSDYFQAHGGDDGLEPAAAGAAASDSQSTKKPQKVTITANRAHLGRTSIGRIYKSLGLIRAD